MRVKLHIELSNFDLFYIFRMALVAASVTKRAGIQLTPALFQLDNITIYMFTFI